MEAVSKPFNNSLSKVKNITNTDKLYAFVVLINIIWEYCTIINDALSGDIITLIMCAIWFIAWFAFSIEKKILKVQIKICFPIIVLLISILFRFLLSGNFVNEFWSPRSVLFEMFGAVYALMMGVSAYFLPAKYKKKIFKWFLIAISITVIPSYFYISRYSDAIRYQPGWYGLINFSYVYAMLPLLGLLVIMAIKIKISGVWRALILLALILNAGIILRSNFTTAILLMVASLFIGLVYNKKISAKRIVIYILVIALIIIIFRQLFADMFVSIANSGIFSEIMYWRLTDVAKFLSTGYLGNSFTDRINLMTNSWMSFLQYPLFGVPFSQISRETLGMHDTWATLLGYSGIFGFLCVLYSILMFYRYIIIKGHGKYFSNAHILLSFVVLILSFLNPTLVKSSLMILFCVMPLSSSFFVKCDAKKKNQI